MNEKRQRASLDEINVDDAAASFETEDATELPFKTRRISVDDGSVHSDSVELPAQMDMDPADMDDDDEEIWEDVQAAPEPQTTAIEISVAEINSGSTADAKTKQKAARRGITAADRQHRMSMHKMHLLFLLVASLHRNRWCNDPLLQARLLSILPHSLALVGESDRPWQWHHTSNATMDRLRQLVQWWRNRFEVYSPEKHANNESIGTPDGPNAIWTQLSRNGIHRYEDQDDEDGIDRSSPFYGRTPVSSAAFHLGFIALCRSIGLDTRMIASLHPISLSMAKQKQPQDSDHVTDESVMEHWCEVFLDREKTWVPVNLGMGVICNPVSSHPSQAVPTQKTLSYALAWESESGVKDVTPRYSTVWNSITRKLRLPVGEDGEGWWKLTLWFYSKSVKADRDVEEDKAIARSHVSEKMPSSLAGFVNHPLYALERHCKKDYVIYPKDRKFIIGVFKNDFVYPRSHVKKLRTDEGWKRFGRQIKTNEDPFMTRTVQRSKRKSTRGSVSRSDDVENDDENDPIKMGDVEGESKIVKLYGEWQTELIEPLELIDGMIPRNAYGNIEVFHPRMVPKGAVHIPVKSAVSVARKLGIDHAPAVVGFQFTGGKATPVVEGIVVAKENEDLIMEAADQDMRIKYAQQQEKKQALVYARWKRLIVGALNRARLFREYGLEP